MAKTKPGKKRPRIVVPAARDVGSRIPTDEEIEAIHMKRRARKAASLSKSLAAIDQEILKALRELTEWRLHREGMSIGPELRELLHEVRNVNPDQLPPELLGSASVDDLFDSVSVERSSVEDSLARLIRDGKVEAAGAGPDNRMRYRVTSQAPRFNRRALRRKILRKKKISRPRGQPRGSKGDPKTDRRVYEANQSGGYKNYASLAEAFKLAGAREAEQAIDRHRKALKKPRALSREPNTSEPPENP